MIDVHHDGEKAIATAEPCACCQKPTHFWFKPKDVPVCTNCAAVKVASEVPDKRTWLAACGIELPEDWCCNAQS